MPQPFTHRFYVDRVLNLAHRGASYDAPENTMPAFQLAAEMGADGIEFDVQLSKDGQVVIIHDANLDKTTNGHGPVNEKTLAELKMLDAGSYFSADFANTPIPTLAELFTVFGPRFLYNIELKTLSWVDQGLEAEVIRLVEDHQLQDYTILSSFNPLALLRAYRANPKIKRGLLWTPDLPFFLRTQLLRPLTRAKMFHPHWEATTAAIIAKEHNRGVLVNVWTCNNPTAMRRLVQLGVNAIMTDRPNLLHHVLHDTKKA